MTRHNLLRTPPTPRNGCAANARGSQPHARIRQVTDKNGHTTNLHYANAKLPGVDDAKAPPFARTVDIHAKPGYDPVEMFIDPATQSIPLDARLIKGSHGAPAVRADQLACLCASSAGLLSDGPSGSGLLRDLDLRGIIETALL